MKTSPKYFFFYLVLSFLFLGLNLQRLQAQFTPPRILKHPSQIRLEPLHILNSPYRETNLNITPDGEYLFFMSTRGGMPWTTNGPRIDANGKLEYDGDIWYSKIVGGKWQPPRALGQNINTSNGEDEPNVSPDGQTVYFQSWYSGWETKGGPYYKASLNGATWSYPRGLGGGINQFFQNLIAKYPTSKVGTDGATMSADGKTFIVAAGIDYYGNMDLYISRKNAYGQWSYLTRLSVSTLGDERSPFLAGDGKTLYFASDGYGGWGGLDIFKTTINPDGSHGEIVNIGAPFNTWLDDYGFTLTSSGDDAFFVREGDIYYADTKEASPEMKPSASTLLLAGKIIDAKTKKPMQAKISIRDTQTGQVIVEGLSNASTGEYTLVIPTDKPNFAQEVTQKEYISFNKNFQVQLKTGLNKVISDIELNKPEPVVVTPEIKKPVESAAEFGKDDKDLR